MLYRNLIIILTHIGIFKINNENEINTMHKFYMIGYQEIEYFLQKYNFKNITTFNAYDALEPGLLNTKRILIIALK